MKYVKKMIIIATVLCCLAVNFIQTCASEDSHPAPRAVFENIPKQSPDLYVTKQVQSAADGFEIPGDVRFTFILKLDKKLADRREYRVFDASGEEVFNTILGMKTPFKTDRYGGFGLSGGQTAMFEYIGIGTEYEILEVPGDNFVQKEPPMGTAITGTMTEAGASEKFVNLYIPDQGKEAGTLKIQKEVSFPSGYIPPPTPEFQFWLKLDGKRYGKESYSIVHTQTGEKLAERMTDQDGGFVLRGGQTAIFEDIPVDVDYEVTEQKIEGWRMTADASHTGATVSPVTLEIFHNASASFAVTKQMWDYSKPEHDFTFLLTKADRSVWQGAEYYLYTAAGEQADEKLHQTDEHGKFVLKPGQTAVFIGADTGTVYNVSEIGTPDYIQLVPSKAEGYIGKTVTDSVEILPFINKPADTGRTLNVTKTVKNITQEAPFEQKLFRFILYKKEDMTGEYLPVKGAVYRVETGSSQMTYKTDDAGGFSIRANETARFTELKSGDYKIEEILSGTQYKPKEDQYVQTGTLSGEPLNFNFINCYIPKIQNLCVLKKNREEEPLEGAEFILYRDEALKDPVDDNPHVTDADGKVCFWGLQTGTYYLKETKSPNGYQLLAEPLKICLTEDGEEEICITVYNRRNYLLPSTGGPGILIPLVVGLSGSLVILLQMKRKKERGENDAE